MDQDPREKWKTWVQITLVQGHYINPVYQWLFLVRLLQWNTNAWLPHLHQEDVIGEGSSCPLTIIFKLKGHWQQKITFYIEEYDLANARNSWINHLKTGCLAAIWNMTVTDVQGKRCISYCCATYHGARYCPVLVVIAITKIILRRLISLHFRQHWPLYPAHDGIGNLAE